METRSRSNWIPRLAILAAVICSQVAHAQAPSATPDAPAPAPKRHVTRAISSITVKVVSPEDYARKAKGADPTVTRDGKPAPWIITSHDADSCVSWVPANAQPNAATAALNAFTACQVLLVGK